MSISVSANNSKQIYEKPSMGEYVGGIAAGAIIQRFVREYSRGLINNPIMDKIVKINDSILQDDISSIENAMEDTVKISGLENKGISIIRAAEKNAKEIYQILRNEFNNNIITKYLYPKKYKEERIIEPLAEDILNGKNALFAYVDKKIVLPENKKMDTAFFHEAGHAMNAFLGTTGKMLRKARATSLLYVPLTWMALFKNKKAPDEKPKNNLDKTTSFIKDHAGILSTLLFVPTIIEEGLASKNGNNFAQKLLSPDLAKKIKITNALGLTTYIVSAIACGLGLHFGIKVKDAIASNKPKTENNSMN